MLTLKTYAVSYAFLDNGELVCRHDSHHIKPSLAAARKNELELLFQERGYAHYDIDICACVIENHEYKAGI